MIAKHIKLTSHIGFAVLIALLLSSSVLIAEDKAPEGASQDAPQIKIVVTQSFLTQLLTSLPKDELTFGDKKIDLRKCMMVPDALKPTQAPRQFIGETDEAYKDRQDKGKRTAKDTLALLTQLPKMSLMLKQLNDRLKSFGDKCEEVTGTKVCVELQSQILNTADQTARELNNKGAALVLFSPDDWKMVSQTTLDPRTKKEIPPTLEVEKIGHANLSLKIPNINMPGISVPKADLGNVVIAWNEQGIGDLVKESGKAGGKRFLKNIDSALRKAAPQLKKQMGNELGIGPAGQSISIATARAAIQAVGQRVLNELFQGLKGQEICDGNDTQQNTVPHNSTKKSDEDSTNPESNSQEDPKIHGSP